MALLPHTCCACRYATPFPCASRSPVEQLVCDVERGDLGDFEMGQPLLYLLLHHHHLHDDEPGGLLRD